MAKSRDVKMNLSSADDLFTTQKEKISLFSKIALPQKDDLYIDIICITQNKIDENRKKSNI